MLTAELFSTGKRSDAIHRGGPSWLRKNHRMVLSWAHDCGIDPAALRKAIEADLRRTAAPLRPIAVDGLPASLNEQFTVVIPCHNYGRYLPEALASLKASTLQPVRVIIVDDSSDQPIVLSDLLPNQFAFKLEVRRVEYRSQHKSCAHGFETVTTRFVVFLDADDMVHPEYFQSSLSIFESDGNTACVFPPLEAFGDQSGPAHGMELAPDYLTIADIESRNWCPAGSIYRTNILLQTLAMETGRVKGCGTNDWITARSVLRAGPWNARKSPVPMYYRIHQGQMHAGNDFGKYELQANLAKEVVTIVILFSGRWDAWNKVREWIATQCTWPKDQLRLLIINTTHAPLSANDLWLGEWHGAALQIERVDLGFPGLADRERRGEAFIQQQVDAAVAGGYNRAFQMLTGEWFLSLEDDVVPEAPDTIERLMKHVRPRVAAISATYKHRYEDVAVAFGPPSKELPMMPLAGTGVRRVVGSGFGCLLARRSVFAAIGLSGDDCRSTFYDVNAGVRVTAAGWQWLLDFDIRCDHLVQNSIIDS